MNSDTLITYSGYILFIIGAILSFFKIKYEIKKRNESDELVSIRDKRFNIYKEFLSKLDLMNSELYYQQFSEEAIKKTNEIVEKIKINHLDISGYYDFIQYQANILFEWIRNYNKYLEELNQLRLIGSAELITLLDKYQDKVKGYLEANAQSMLMHQVSLPGHFDLTVVENYVNNLNELNEIRKQLGKQMRLDIGNIK